MYFGNELIAFSCWRCGGQEGRIRSLTREEFARLLEELPEHLADMARFSVATGLRQANVTR